MLFVQDRITAKQRGFDILFVPDAARFLSSATFLRNSPAWHDLQHILFVPGCTTAVLSYLEKCLYLETQP